MDEKIKKEILERFEKLPKDIQQAIFSADFPNKIEAIKAKYTLSDEQSEDLSNEAMFVMIGLEHPGQFVDNVKKNLEITYEKASIVATEVNETIFKQIRESLKTIHPAEISKSPSPETILNRQVFGIPPAPRYTTPPQSTVFNPPPQKVSRNLEVRLQDDNSAPIPPNFAQKPKEIIPNNLPTGEEGNNPWGKVREKKPPEATLIPAAPKKSLAETIPPNFSIRIPSLQNQKVNSESNFKTSLTSKISSPPPNTPIIEQLVKKVPEPTTIKEAQQESLARKSMVEQKLNSTVTIPKEEKHYVMDPYREQA